jgi:hypothetical protein
MIGITITVERPNDAGFDKYGDPKETAVTTHDISGCAAAPMSAQEILERGRDASLMMLRLLAPSGSDILKTDRVIIAVDDPNPGRYEIDGEPQEWRSAFTGWGAGLEVVLRRADG